MNLITDVNSLAEEATVYDLDNDGLPVVNLPVTGMTMQEAIDFIEMVATGLLAEQDRQDDPHLASRGIGWRPQ